MNLQPTTYDIYSPAKVNLRLKVNGLRENGYHLLSMLNVTASLKDYFKIKITNDNEFKVSKLVFGPLIIEDQKQPLNEVLLNPEKNLALRAGKLFFSKFAIEGGIDFELCKNIPSGAGLGGGSSNAGSLLKFLRQHFKRDLNQFSNSEKIINEIACSLGADVPFSYQGGAAIVNGIGEVVIPLSSQIQSAINGWQCMILTSGTHVSTVDVFAFVREKLKVSKFTFNEDTELAAFRESSFSSDFEIRQSILSLIENDLESAAVKLCPEIGKILCELPQIQGIKHFMTGSGSSVVVLSDSSGIFSAEHRQALKSVISALKINHFDGCFQLY
ncbi:MAG: hypothetical protein SGJ02_00190 [bacterium]|nr:hypothetical protein [bacterium]